MKKLTTQRKVVKTMATASKSGGKCLHKSHENIVVDKETGLTEKKCKGCGKTLKRFIAPVNEEGDE